MTPEEFEQAVLADEITDFEPYLKKTTTSKKTYETKPIDLFC